MSIIFVDMKNVYFSKMSLIRKVKLNGDKNGIFICITKVKSYQF